MAPCECRGLQVATKGNLFVVIRSKANQDEHPPNHEDTKMKKPFIVDVRPVRSEKLTPQEYLRLQAESPTLIERAEFLPPGIGAQGFGAFFVRYTRARHRPLSA